MPTRNLPHSTAPTTGLPPSPWRLPDPAPRPHWTRSAWLTSALGLVALGLLITFVKVVNQGVQRGEQLRSQFASVTPTCHDLSADQRRQACADGAEAEAPVRTVAQRSATRFADGPVLVAYRR